MFAKTGASDNVEPLGWYVNYAFNVRCIKVEDSRAVPIRSKIAKTNVPLFVSMRALFESCLWIIYCRFGAASGILDKDISLYRQWW